MGNWQAFCNLVNLSALDLDHLKTAAKSGEDQYGVYPDSIQAAAGCLFLLARDSRSKMLIVIGQDNDVYRRFCGTEYRIADQQAKACAMNNANCQLIRQLIPYTNPVSHQGRKITIGLGDRLGLASPGHIRLVKQYDVFPVLAQQSMRELNLTGRTYADVLAAAAWAVFQEGYDRGYGADGDHLKTAEEVKLALNLGFTMITLDCSEHIHHEAAELPLAAVNDRYAQLPESERVRLERQYLDREFTLTDDFAVTFALEELKRIVLIYDDAVKYAIRIYHEVIAQAGRTIDFEMSIDETLTSTSPASHYFVASELIGGKVAVTSLAPRFFGEFQKGIDYRGEISRFTEEFIVHVKIAEFFGYKISVHSGSDKFSVFPIIGQYTGGKYHLKTAGTNWLEAIRLIAGKDPDLYRRIHRFALANLGAALKYYHISADPDRIAPLDSLTDQELPDLMNQDDARQVIHITYGLILQAKLADGSFMFRDEIYQFLDQYEQAYSAALQRHIGKHLTRLGLA